jgi:predicted amidohydrolase
MRIGIGQMLVEFGAAAENLERACAMIRRAGEQRCDFIVLPECLDLGWTFPEAAGHASPIPGPRTVQLAAAARAAGVHVAAGLTERDGDRVYNAAVLLAPSGEILRRHRKVNELDIAQHLYARGESIGVARTPFGPVGLNICADNFPETPALGQAVALMGSRLLLSPCAWAVDSDHDNDRAPYGELWKNAYGRLASECGLTVVGTSNVGWLTGGPWAGRKCIGCSLALGPAGVLAQGCYGAEDFLWFDLH